MSRKVRLGLIGTGFISQGAHVKGYEQLADKCEVVTICDLKHETREIMRTKFGFTGANYTDDYKQILNDPDIDAVVIATPNAVHMQPTLDALAAGKHVLCEKPLAMNAEQAKAMCRAAKDSGKILQVALQYRFSGFAQFTAEFIRNGHMGDIYFARARALRRRGVPGWGVFIDKEKQGGGPLIDIGVHILDLTLFLMGYPKPVAASGKTWDMLGKNPDNRNFWGEYDRDKFTVEDFAVGMIRFENGAVISLESSFMANIEGDPMETQVFGTKAGAIVKALGEDPVTIFKQIDGQYFEMKPQNIPHVESPYVAEIEAFVDAIQNGKPSPVPGENGLTLNAIFDALYKSSASGKEELVNVDY
ncbi:MAG: Gfo/Idh/MocA family oxidoreductase [Chthonomonas sp.]|nr:Gfo/Idh/MocA family oxidoreductase [Chthonomonas sp.]